MRERVYSARKLEIVSLTMCLDREPKTAAKKLKLSIHTIHEALVICRKEAAVKTNTGLALWLVYHGYITLNNACTAYEPTKNVNHLRHRE